MKSLYLTSSKRIKMLRVTRGYSVSELAESADISTKFLYSIEAGKAGHSAAVLLKLAKEIS